MDFNHLFDEAGKFLAQKNATTPAPTAEQQPAESAAERPAVTHSQPILAGGAAGEPVQQLVRLLEVCGFSNNSIAKGENADGILDSTVMADVRAFCDKHGVAEDPEIFNGENVAPRDLIGHWVGPHTWQALYDEASRIIREGA
jgi:peptidoglycan hydrolase-like protein with peptidoglycan-binding domain